MSIKRNRLGLAIALVVLAGMAGEAKAGFLGDSINLKYYSQSLANLIEDDGTKVVDPVASFSSVRGRVTSAVSDTQISFTFNTQSGFITGSFSGFVFTDTSNNPGITGATIDPSSDYDPSFTQSDITFTSDQIQLNLESTGFNVTNTLVIDVQFGGSAVPEPSSLLLSAIAGLSGLGYWGRKRLKAIAA